MDNKDQFQLIPGTRKKLGIKVPGENRFLYIGSAILGAVLVVTFAFGRYETNLFSKLDVIANQIKELEGKRDIKGEQDLRILQKQIENTSALVNNHVYWSRGLAHLSSLMQNGAQIKSFNYNGFGKISMEVFVLNYTILAKQIASFVYEESIEDVSVSKISPLPTGLLKFDVTLTIDEAKLVKNLLIQ